MVVGPPLDGSSNELADWIELEVLASAAGSAPLQAINQTLEIAENDEPAELDEEGLLCERRLQQVVTAIEERQRTIGDAYPFAIDKTGSTVSFRPELTHASYAYLFCLVVSEAATDGLLGKDNPWSPDLDKARRLFQSCATVACAGHVRGPAFSVGWPRPDSSSFLAKLKSVYAALGDGRPHATPPPGAPIRVKDDEIDVIAWAHEDNLKPRTGYFLGQAASGADWPDKSLKGRTDKFHKTWFACEPAAQCRIGTIMPFCLPSPADADPTDHASQDEIEGELRRHVATHGDLLHRHRVARCLQVGSELHVKGVCSIEGVGDLPEVDKYVQSYRAQLQGAVANL